MGIQCPKCQSDNPETQSFCGDCGTQLPTSEEFIPSLTKTLETSLKGFTKGSTVAGRYEVIEELGIGGMGVVYKAKDTKLKRTVALKFLSPELTRNIEAKERFIHEAQAASALDHPNICTVFEIDEAEGQMFITMAYIEGHSLREKIEKGPLKLDEALVIAMQVAEGLYEAHEKGIVHRDIKSANIMVTIKDQAKIMDFGVAKLTGQTKFTRTGTTMGTVAYMSPEQACGEKVDHRTDIWSLGVVLYEKIIGKLPFKGDHEQAVMYSILNEEPEPMTSLRTGVPMELERIVRKALAKNPDERYQHADDMMVDLKALKNNLTAYLKAPTAAVKPAAVPTPVWQRPLLWKILAGVTTLVAVVALWSTLQPRLMQPQPPTRFFTALPQGQTMEDVGWIGSAVALSPDGSKLVYVAHREETVHLYLRRMDEFEAVPIPGTEGGRGPFFSPDGNHIGFSVGRKLKKVSLLGGTPTDICRVEVGCFGADWGPDNTAIFSDCTYGLRRVPVTGGEIEIVSRVLEAHSKKLDRQHHYPQLLPGGKTVLFTVHNQPKDISIALCDMDTGEIRFLIEQGSCARYLPSGHLVFGWAGNLLAVPFDLKRLEVKGQPVTVLEGVMMEEFRGVVHFSVSENGTLAYIPGGLVKNNATLVWVDFSGESKEIPFPDIPGLSPRVSPDGLSLVVNSKAVEGGRPEMRVFGLERSTMRRLTDETGDEFWSIWDTDSTHVIYNSNRHGGAFLNLFRQSADGSGSEERLTTSEIHQQPCSISPDGNVLAFTQCDLVPTATGIDIWMLPMEEDRKPFPFVDTRFDEVQPMFSPDGHWLAYASNETGTWEVYVRPYPGPGGITPISSTGGWEPLWSPDGKELYYRDMSGEKVMAVVIESGQTLRVGKSRLLFEGPYAEGSIWGRMYDLAPDGKRFLMKKYGEPPALPTQHNIVLHWFEELKRLVPSGK